MLQRVNAVSFRHKRFNRAVSCVAESGPAPSGGGGGTNMSVYTCFLLIRAESRQWRAQNVPRHRVAIHLLLHPIVLAVEGLTKTHTPSPQQSHYLMPSELRDGFPAAKCSEVPDFEATVVRTGRQEICHICVPADNIYILLVRVHAKHSSVLLAKIPHCHRFISRGRRKHLSRKNAHKHRRNKYN